MTKKITFHKHEVVGAQLTKDMLARRGFPKHLVKDVSKLVRHHQFRFYEETKPSTIKKWMRELGKTDKGELMWKLALLLRLYDRAANPKNNPKPLITKEWQDLYDTCTRLDKEIVYYEDLELSVKDMHILGLPKTKTKEALSNMISIVENNSKLNTKKYLTEFIQKNYGDKNDH